MAGGKLELNKSEIYNEWSAEVRNRKIYVAICYVFYKTLALDDMQTFTLMPSL